MIILHHYLKNESEDRLMLPNEYNITKSNKRLPSVIEINLTQKLNICTCYFYPIIKTKKHLLLSAPTVTPLILWLLQTFGSSGFIIRLADELPILHEVELIPSVEGPRAGRARKTPHVVDVGLRAPDHLRGRDALPASRALGAEPPGTTAANEKHYHREM